MNEQLTPDAPHAVSQAERVIVLAPLGRDAAVVSQVLSEGAIACATAGDIDELTAMARDGVGAVLVTEEALPTVRMAELVAALAEQPQWSDLPVLLLLAEGERLMPETARRLKALRGAGNITILVRPVPAVALLTAVQAALRARRRQYEVRDLVQREHDARLDAEHANRLKDDFLAVVSHELRTPLSAILLWSRLAASGRLETKEVPKALESIERSATAQTHLIEDLLDASRMISGKLRLRASPGQLEPAARAAVDVVRSAADAKGVKLQVRLDSHAGVVLADADRIQQIVSNLLSNAVKFTPSGGSVDIDLHREGEQVCICVEDTGQGISADFLPHVFERFRQHDVSITRHQGGLGLGLAISRQLTELHGGTLTAASAGEGQGSQFALCLPRLQGNAMRARRGVAGASNDPGATIAGATTVTSRRLQGLRILVVDDEADGRDAMVWILRDAGAQVTAVGSAADAMAVLTEAEHDRQPHILLSDIAMPGEDGYQLIQRIRALPASRGGQIAAAAVSAHASKADRARTLAAGFQIHLAKPLDPICLVDSIAALAQTHAAPAGSRIRR